MVLRELSAVMQMGNKVVTRTELSSLGWKLFLFMGSYREKGDMKMSEKKESVKTYILGKWDTRTIVGVAIGAALFGVLMNFGGIRVFTNTSLTTAMLVDVIVGGLFGAVPAAVAAFFGNVISDLIGGWGFWFDWSIGNAVLGFFVGLLGVYGARINDGIFTGKQAVIYAVLVIVGNAVAFGLVTPFLTYVFADGVHAEAYQSDDLSGRKGADARAFRHRQVYSWLLHQRADSFFLSGRDQRFAEGVWKGNIGIRYLFSELDRRNGSAGYGCPVHRSERWRGYCVLTGK